MSRSTIQTSRAPAAIGPYSQAIRVGPTIYCSGQIGLDPATGQVSGDLRQQTQQVLDNLKAVLEAAGATFDDVVKTTVYLVRMEDFAIMNAVYERGFGAAKPARATVGVAQLPREALVEIECIAYRPV